MSFFEYIRSRELYKYHSEGASPWPSNIQVIFAEKLLQKCKKMEEQFPVFPEMYDKYLRDKYV
jgi:hypothetical protein